MDYTRKDLLKLGVKKLRSFGFINADETNLLADEVYRFYFLRFMVTFCNEDPAVIGLLKEMTETPYEKQKNDNNSN